MLARALLASSLLTALRFSSLGAEFGYGLSYSTFTYDNLVKDATFQADSLAIQSTNEKFAGQASGDSLYDTLVTVHVDVTNTGDMVACEVAQLVSPKTRASVVYSMLFADIRLCTAVRPIPRGRRSASQAIARFR